MGHDRIELRLYVIPPQTNPRQAIRGSPYGATRSARWITSVLTMLAGVVGFVPSASAHHPEHLACAVNQTVGDRRVLRNCAHVEALEMGEHGARHFLEHHSLELGLADGGSDLVTLEEKHGLGGVRTHFQQHLAGLPIYGAYTTVNQDNQGVLSSLYLRYRTLAPGNPVPTVSEATAEQTGRENADIQSTRLPTQSQLAWYPLANGTARLAWQFMIFSDDPLGDFLTLVDAHSGKVLVQENRINFVDGQGLVYEPNPMQTSGNTSLSDNGDATSAALDAQRVNTTLPGLDAGVGTLKGIYVDLVSLAGGKPEPDPDEPTRVYNYDRDDPRFEAVVIYKSVHEIQSYFHSLGFDNDVGAANGIRDFPTLAHAHWNDEDQSFYSTGDDAIHFGDGGVDDGEDADIVAHEYGHAVQHDQNACWGGGEMGAMGEGFGDYLAASFYASAGDATYQASNAECVGEWDASSYSSTNPPCLRRVDGNKTYPTDLVGAVHADGEIWSRALWDIRGSLGGPTADQLVLEHHFNVPCGASMTDAANELLQADVNLNGGANASAIRQAFCDRGILSGAACAPPSDLTLSQAIAPDPPVAGQNAVYTLSVTNSANSTITGVQLSATVPSGSTYVSASNGGTESGGTVSWAAFDVLSGATVVRTFEVAVDVSGGSVTLFADDMEVGGALWAVSHDNALGNYDWSLGTTNAHQKTSNVQPHSAKATDCLNGAASGYPCENVDLHAYIPIAELGGTAGSDGWGWTDPLTGTEYAIVGRNNGTSFLDLSDPANPVHVGNLPTHSVNSDWRDIKVYQDHAFIVSEASSHGMQVFDLTQLRNVPSPPATFTNTAHYSGFSTAHNIAINTDTGVAFAVGANVCSGGLHMIDISNPVSPTQVGCYSGDGYTHDVQCVVYSGPDAAHTGKEICFASNEDTLTIVDVTNKASPVQLARTPYTGSQYSHQAWLTPNQQYLLMDDELDEQNNSHNTRTYVWDVSDLDAPTVVGSHTSHLPVIDHNLYIKDCFVYQANYEGGLRILLIDDLSQASLCEVASFDVYPASNNAAFHGAWNAYPFFDSGIVVVNAIEGVGIVQPQLTGLSCATSPPNFPHAWFASDPDTTADQYLATASPFTATAATTMSFWHDYDTEQNYDGGVAEYSVNGGTTWTDLGSLITDNGYVGNTISSSYNSPIAGRNAFNGSSSGYLQTVADLSSLQGQDVQIRFRMSSDNSVSGTGWYLDDVEVGDIVKLTSAATASGGASATSTITSNVAAPAGGNNNPVLATNTGITAGEGASVVIGPSALEVTDGDTGQTLTFTVSAGPTNGSLNLGTSFTQTQIDANALQYTHNGGETTSDAFTFSVSDGNGGSIGATVFAVTVTPANDPPAISISSLPGAQVGVSYSANWTATDPDPGDTVGMSLLGAPAWVTGPTQNLDGSWSLGGTPSAGDEGSTAVTLRAQDDASPPATTDVATTLQVSPAAPAVPAFSPLAYGTLVACMGFLAHRRLRRSAGFGNPDNV